MADCIHNQLQSFRGRYFKVTPDPQYDRIDWNLLLRIIKHLSAKMREVYNPEWTFARYVASKPGGSRRRFLKAYNQLCKGTRDLTKISKITAFVKNERYFEEGKHPRLIMGRDPRFNIYYARHIARLEDAFFQLPQVANACDFFSCGEKFSKLLAKATWMFENDMSAYESSQRMLYMVIEWLVYAFVTPEEEVCDLSVLFAVKMMKAGHTNEGLKFLFEYCRGSGDVDTGLGNGVGNYVTTMYFKIVNYCPLSECRMDGLCCDFDGFVVKGDDSYGSSPPKEPVDTYSYFGLSAKLIIRKDPRLTEFCSGNFVQLADGRYYYVQKLRKLITSLTTIINRDVIEHGWAAHYYRSLGDMYGVLYGELPVYGSIAKFLQTAAPNRRININLVNESYGHSEAFKVQKRNVQKIDVSPQTLLDVSLVNDFSLPELSALDAYFRSSRISLPEQHQRRCNIKSHKGDAIPEIDESITVGFDKSTMHIKTRAWQRYLMWCFRDPVNGLRGCHIWDKSTST